MLDLLRARGPLSAGFLCHSYSGSADLIPELVQLGGHFSFSGAVTFSRNKRGRLSAAAVPSDRLCAETDAPDILPYMPDQPPPAGTAERPPNEPAHLTYVLRALAEIRGEAVDRIAALTFENACRLFGGRAI